MTSKQIEDLRGNYIPDITPDSYWLREIAYQLAVMNERNREDDRKAVEDIKRRIDYRESKEG
jgi:hypothetical protein